MAQNTEVLFAAGRIANDEMGEIQGNAGAAGLFLFSGWSGNTNGYVVGQLDVDPSVGNQSGAALFNQPQPSGWGRYISATLGTT